MKRLKVKPILRLMVFATVVALSSGCDTKGPSQEKSPTTPAQITSSTSSSERILPPAFSWNPGDFDRTEIKAHIKEKIKNGEPLIAHILVPLCDNEHQGIVPVNASLGNGQNIRTNLYWGAGYGIKTHFKRSKDWITVHEEKPKASHILDRVVFRKKFPNGATVYLIADAYDGAHMKHTLNDFMASLAGKKTGKIVIGEKSLAAWGGADLIGFNGHNGLMDMNVSPQTNIDGRKKDAVVIACASHSYFVEHLARSGGYPLVCTTNLLAPEAYVLRNVLDAWGKGEPAPEVRLAAGRAYNQYQKCGLKGATRLFKTGW